MFAVFCCHQGVSDRPAVSECSGRVGLSVRLGWERGREGGQVWKSVND